MSWNAIETKHKEQWQAFATLRQAIWDKIENENSSIRESYGREENIPSSMRMNMQTKQDNYHREWGTNGTIMLELRAAQKIEKDNYTKKYNDFKQQLKQGRELNEKDKGNDGIDPTD